MAVVSFYVHNRTDISLISIKPCCEKQCLAKLCTQHPDQVGRWRNKLEQKDSKSEDNRKVMLSTLLWCLFPFSGVF